MNCQRVRELLPLYVDSELEGREQELVAQHLAGCPECRRRAELDRQLAQALTDLPVSPAVATMAPALRARVMAEVGKQRRWQPFWQTAGSLANAAVAMGILAVASLLVVALAVTWRAFAARTWPGSAPATAARGVGRVIARDETIASPYYWVVDGERVDRTPRLSPDGARLAYLPTVDGQGTDLDRLVVREVATGQERDLTPEPGYSYTSVRWSPDSRSVAFVKYRDVGREPEASELWRVDADGRNLKLLYRPAPEAPGMRGPAMEIVRWTADGRYIELAPTIWSPGGPVRRVRADGGGEETRAFPIAQRFGAREDALQGEMVSSPVDNYDLYVARTAGLQAPPKDAPADGTSLVLYDVRADRSRVLASFAGSAYIAAGSISPDGSWILVDEVAQPGEPARTWALRPDGKGRHELVGGAQGLVHAGRPLWSGPDRVYFNVPPRSAGASVPGSLYELDVAGGKVGLVTNDWPEQSIVSISRDGSRMLVIRGEWDKAELHLLELAPRPVGGPTATVAPTSAPDEAPRFGPPQDLAELPASVGSDYTVSPDDRRLAYIAPEEVLNGQTLPRRLVERDLETGEVGTLLDQAPAGTRVVAWLGDQVPPRQMLVLVGPGGGQGGAIEIIDLAAHVPYVLATPEGDSQGFGEAVISPDRQWVAFTVLHVAGQAPVSKIGVEVMRLDGGNRRQLVAPDYFIEHLAWRADGRQVVYFKGKGGTPPDDGEAYAVNVDGSAAPELVLPRVRLVAWSPDGTQALWLGEPADAQGKTDLWLTGLWPTTADYVPSVRGVGDSGAAFAGSARWVVYSQDGALYLMSVGSGARGQSQRLTPEGEWAGAPVWVPGRGLIYAATKGGAANATLRLLPLAGVVSEPSEPAVAALTVEEHAVAGQATGFPTATEGTAWIGPQILDVRRAWREPTGAERVAASNAALRPFGYRLEPKEKPGYGQPFYDLYQGDRVILADLSAVWPVSVNEAGDDFALVVAPGRGPNLLVRRSGSQEWDMTIKHRQQPPVLVGQDLVAVEGASDLQNVTVLRGGKPVYTSFVRAEPTSDPVKGLWSWQGHWVLEVAGKVIVDGQELNSQLGYDEIFNWRLVRGKPFYFFRQGNLVGVSYAGLTLPQQYEQVPHYQCCSGAAYNPGGNDNMVWFFGLRGGQWYYVEMGIYGSGEAPVPQPTAAPSPAQALQAVATWQGATGSLAGTILFTNEGPSPVTLQGSPQVAIVDASGQELPTVRGEWQDPTGAPDPVVVLQPGRQAQVPFIWANYCGTPPAAPLTLRIGLPGGEQLTAPVLDPAGKPVGGTPRCNTDAPASALTVGVFQAVGEGATPVPFPSPVAVEAPRLTSVRMIDAATGWAVAENAILRTADGGGHWADVTPLQGASFVSGTVSYGLAGSAFLDAQRAWLAYGSDPQTPMMVFRTADGGRTWQSSLLPAAGMGGQFSFVDAQHGWLLLREGAAAGSEGVAVLRTDDGGASWALENATDPQNLAPGSLPFSGSKSGLGARDATTAWLSGYMPVDGHIYLYVTRDGGKTWQDQAVPMPQGYEQAQATSRPPVFGDALHGVFWASLSSGRTALVLYRTSDGGATWAPSAPLAPGGTPYFAVAVASPNDAWALAAWGEEGRDELYRTRDGGRTWEQVSAGAGLMRAEALQFQGESGWALVPGALLRTADGGKTWAQVP